MASPELETLDQLLSGDLPLSVIRNLYPDDDAFISGVFGLLNCGDVRLFAAGRPDVPNWYWRELFVQKKILDKLADFQLGLSNQGAKRIG
jgi:hypothetical protein